MTDEALARTEELELQTRGRRTGRIHSVRLWFAHADGVLWLRADERAPDWLRNLREHPECVVRIGGHDLRARYEPVADRHGALRKLVELWRAKYGAEWVEPWYVEKGREPVLLRIVA
ncbi:MAG: nitroreductase family deazaflavin-dependent oxidoreductase [Chloroflexi bacterium]|nr:nitroreductase family deazaflavin-dependent oxidoreductase [Chloroflexota bacterium]